MFDFKVALATILLICLPVVLQAEGHIIWDVSHGPVNGYDLEGEYSSLEAVLDGLGFRVTATGESVVERGLWDAEILVVSILSNYETPYSPAEIIAIRHFVQTGGGLIILADNTNIRPGNIADLALVFGVRVARDDRIGTLSRPGNGDLMEGVDSVEIAAGSGLQLVAGGGAVIEARDAQNIIGISSTAFGEGNVVIIGDANLWANDLINRAGNLRLAENCFELLNHTRLGRIAVDQDARHFYLPEETGIEFEVTVSNQGEGSLGFRMGTETPANIVVEVSYGILDSDESAQVTVQVSSDGLEADEILEASLIVEHNDPTRDAIILPLIIHTLSREPTHFTPPQPTGIDHSLIISDVNLPGHISPVGLEVGVFTPGGFCAGAGRYTGEPLGFPARGDDAQTEDQDGFEQGEPFLFKIFTPWDERELAAHINFEAGPNHFRVDGMTLLSLDSGANGEVTLQLTSRWNLVSLNVEPTSLDPNQILAPLLDAGTLMMVKDGAGQFWDVVTGFSNLGAWNLAGAYQIKVSQVGELTIDGRQIDPETPIEIENGWSSVAYWPTSPLPVAEAFASLGESLEIVKRGDGAFWLRRWGWDGLGMLEPGFGYQMWTREAGVLIYPANQERMAGVWAATPLGDAQSERSMSLLLVDLPSFSSVEVFSDDLRVGEGVAAGDGRAGIAVWEDDPVTNSVEGAQDGNPLDVFINGSEVELLWIEGSPFMKSGSFAVASFASTTVTTKAEFTASLSPNPFNDRTFLTITGANANSQVEIYDLAGRCLTYISAISTGKLAYRRIEIPAGNLPAGLLVVKVTSSERSMLLKLVHLP